MHKHRLSFHQKLTINVMQITTNVNITYIWTIYFFNLFRFITKIIPFRWYVAPIVHRLKLKSIYVNYFWGRSTYKIIIFFKVLVNWVQFYLPTCVIHNNQTSYPNMFYLIPNFYHHVFASFHGNIVSYI